MVDITDKVVEASVALLVLSAIGLTALIQLFTSPATSIPATVLFLVTTFVGIMFAIGIALMFYRTTKHD